MSDLSKRGFLATPLLAATALGVARLAQAQGCEKPAPAAYKPPPPNGPFTAAADSLRTAAVPSWFRDAKLGIWSHWGPQAVPGQGDWYARFMYVPGHPHYEHHVKTYGHPSEVGYKDILKLWKAERFEPEALMDRYVAAGAKYFVSMGVHHDNFDLWNSKHHRWNATKLGPMRDIVGDWSRAARKRGLRFGVSEHLGASHNWWWTSHQCDQFYHEPHDTPYLNRGGDWYTHNPKFHEIWYRRVADLIDSHQPDLLYSDGGIPFGEVGRAAIAHLFNTSVRRNGDMQAVYNHKALGSGEFIREVGVQDVERGVLEGINPLPWQTDTSNGDWFFSERDRYKTPAQVLTMLCDIVSKNGNMLLNVVQRADGSLAPESDVLLTEMAAWMKVNGEAIHGTRPWKIYGEGPTTAAAGAFQEDTAYKAQDIRFTTRGDALYALTLGEPKGTVKITSLRRGNPHDPRTVRKVELLGVGPLPFRQNAQALEVDVPERLPSRHASALRITRG
jgi:alpha-L-fucosidase